jgi:hypothetical protein
MEPKKSNMKTIHSLTRLFLLLAVTAGCNVMAYAQDGTKSKKADKAALIQNIVEAQNYVFRAQMALPMSGRSRQLTSEYNLQVGRDTVVAYLPYFGRAYSAPIGNTDGGINFLSKDFDYQKNERKKGGWEIVIKPRDYKEVQQMTLSISTDGYASLQVTSTNRQPISFNGYVTEKRIKKHK